MAKLTNTNTTSMPKADAFLNIRIQDKSGNSHSFKTGVPLYKSRKLDAAVMSNVHILEEALLEGRISLSLFILGEESTMDF